MFFLVAALADKTPGANPYLWIAIEVIVGGIFVLGILGINKAVNVLIAGRNEPPETH